MSTATITRLKHPSKDFTSQDEKIFNEFMKSLEGKDIEVTARIIDTIQCWDLNIYLILTYLKTSNAKPTTQSYCVEVMEFALNEARQCYAERFLKDFQKDPQRQNLLTGENAVIANTQSILLSWTSRLTTPKFDLLHHLKFDLLHRLITECGKKLWSLAMTYYRTGKLFTPPSSASMQFASLFDIDMSRINDPKNLLSKAYGMFPQKVIDHGVDVIKKIDTIGRDLMEVTFMIHLMDADMESAKGHYTDVFIRQSKAELLEEENESSSAKKKPIPVFGTGDYTYNPIGSHYADTHVCNTAESVFELNAFIKLSNACWAQWKKIADDYVRNQIDIDYTEDIMKRKRMRINN